MKITVTGDLGSGKSTIAREISRRLSARYVYTGLMHRNIATQYSVDSLSLNKIAFTDKGIDDRIDSYLKSLNGAADDFVIDSRMAWHFVTDTTKIYLRVSPRIAAQRIMDDKIRSNEPKYADLESALASIAERKHMENTRFSKKYNVSCDNMENYDLVVDTSIGTVDETCDLILNLLEKEKGAAAYPRIWASPKSLFPTEKITSLGTEDAEHVRNSIAALGFDPAFPLQCVRYDDRTFIWNGHKRCSAALAAGLTYIPILEISEKEIGVQKGDLEEMIRASINLSLYYDWEAAHGFRFTDYPETI